MSLANTMPNDRKVVKDLAERVKLHRSSMAKQQPLSHHSVIRGDWQAEELKKLLAEELPNTLELDCEVKNFLGPDGETWTSVRVNASWKRKKEEE